MWVTWQCAVWQLTLFLFPFRQWRYSCGSGCSVQTQARTCSNKADQLGKMPDQHGWTISKSQWTGYRWLLFLSYVEMSRRTGEERAEATWCSLPFGHMYFLESSPPGFFLLMTELCNIQLTLLWQIEFYSGLIIPRWGWSWCWHCFMKRGNRLRWPKGMWHWIGWRASGPLSCIMTQTGITPSTIGGPSGFHKSQNLL